MSLFDKVFGGSSDKMTEAEGVAGIALAAIASDGMITEEEVNGLATSLARMKLFDHDARKVQKALERSVKFMRTSKNPEQLLQTASDAVPQALRATTFAIAADLLMADGFVAGDEKAFLERIQKSLGVPDDVALKVVEVIAIKNQG